MTAFFYSLIFIIPGIFALESSIKGVHSNHIFFACFVVVLSLIIGLRFEVGPDWFLYVSNMEIYSEFSFENFFLVGDPGYALLNSIALDLNFGIWFPNLLCGIIFCYGLFVFCKKTPNPWLALTIAIPYAVMVMSMNYTRQAAAFGIYLLALNHAFDNRFRSLFLMGLATIFHKSAIIGFFLIIFTSHKIKIWHMFVISALTYSLFLLFIAPSLESIYLNYVAGEMNSDGAEIRLALNLLPASIFLFFRNKFLFSESQNRFWTILSIAVLSLIPMLILTPSSTIIDRFNLYFFIIQIFLATHIPFLVKAGAQRLLATFTLVLLYGLSFFVWMYYANFSWAWFPYRFYLFEAL